MDRRSTIKSLLIISAGAALLPSCLQQDKKKSSLSLKNIKTDGNDEEFLAALSEIIIPKTGTPGAKEVAAHLFALMMVDDCYPPDSRDKFVDGLKEFKELSKKKFDKTFIECSPAEKKEILTSLGNKKGVPESVAFFYDSMKRLTIQAFTSSEYYLTKVQVYKLVPGKFYGCVPVKKAS